MCPCVCVNMCMRVCVCVNVCMHMCVRVCEHVPMLMGVSLAPVCTHHSTFSQQKHVCRLSHPWPLCSELASWGAHV